MTPILNLKPSPKDVRDFKFKASAPIASLPDSVDLRGTVAAPVLDQGPIGSCVGHGASEVCYAAMSQATRFIASRLFIYWAARFYEGFTEEDSGVTIVDGLKAVNKLGCPPESLWPYDVTRFKERPPRAAYREAVKHQAVEYSSVESNWDAIRFALATRLPVLIGLQVFPSFEDAKGGVIEAPRGSVQSRGGHCTTLVGYQEDYAILRNSWSEKWGRGGDALIHRDYLTNPDVTFDLWRVKTIAARVKMFDFLGELEKFTGLPLEKLMGVIPDILDLLSDLGDGDLRLTVKNRLLLQERLDSLLGGLPHA